MCRKDNCHIFVVHGMHFLRDIAYQWYHFHALLESRRPCVRMVYQLKLLVAG